MTATLWLLTFAHFNSVTDPNIEADDTMGIIQTATDEDSVIVTVDKDLLQIPGKMYNPVKDTHHVTTPEEGWHLFLTQWLTGDSTDGYPGLKGIGPKKAKKIITEADDPVRAIVDLYERELVCVDHGAEPRATCGGRVTEVHVKAPELEPCA